MQEPDPTPFDLNWRMFGVPIRVHPFFWILAAFLGWDLFSGRLPYLLLWIGCVFLSILLHEFGHVVAGRLFGAHGRILLYSFGGLAIGSNNVRERWKRVVVSLAGPLVQLLLVAAIFPIRLYVRTHFQHEFPLPARIALECLYEINLIWGLFNLLPICPLDGGQIAREVCEMFAPGRGGVFALGISTLISGAIALLILLASLKRIDPLPVVGDSMFNAMLFAMFAASNFQAMQFEKARQNWDDRLPWER
jgi:Zn-dependent protease